MHLFYLQCVAGHVIWNQQQPRKESSSATTVEKFTFDTALCGDMAAMSAENLQSFSALSVTIEPNRK